MKEKMPPNMHVLYLDELMRIGFNKQFGEMALMMKEAKKRAKVCECRARGEGATESKCAWAYHNELLQFAGPQLKEAVLHLEEMCGILGFDMKEFLVH